MSKSGVFFVTGKLGAGKSLVSVSRIQDYLERGCRVATNLDLDLRHLLPRESNRSVLRLPDKPNASHMRCIGFGYGDADTKEHDESKFGLVVLDEMATYLNTRDWRDSERAELIDWFRHARKWRWDVYFLVQDIDSLDPQLVKALAEHVVVCKRTDKLSVPILSSLMSVAGIDRILPKIHIAKVYYGTPAAGLVVDRWIYRGTSLYKAYDTEQKFSDDVMVVRRPIQAEVNGKRVTLNPGDTFDMRAVHSLMPPRYLFKVDYVAALRQQLRDLEASINAENGVSRYAALKRNAAMAALPLALFLAAYLWSHRPRSEGGPSHGLAAWVLSYLSPAKPAPAAPPPAPVARVPPVQSIAAQAPAPVTAPPPQQDRLYALMSAADNTVTSSAMDEFHHVISLRIRSTDQAGVTRYYDLGAIRMLGYVVVPSDYGIELLSGPNRISVPFGRAAQAERRQAGAADASG